MVGSTAGALGDSVSAARARLVGVRVMAALPVWVSAQPPSATISTHDDDAGSDQGGALARRPREETLRVFDLHP